MPDDLTPQMNAFLDKVAEAGIPKLVDLTPQQARDLMEALSAARLRDFPAPAVAYAETFSTGPGYGHVPVRVYKASNAADLPVIIYYHGGGHVIGSLEIYETLCRFLANAAGCAVVSVDYRMGPEHRFPAAAEDSYDALRWVADKAGKLGIDATRIAVSGDSAGGNLAAVVALMAREAGGPAVSAQALIYPVVDYRGGTASYDRYGAGYGILEAPTIDWFREHYFANAHDMDDWRAAPHLATSHAGLPPALVITAECDVLKDEGVAYAKQLSDAGVAVEHTDYAGVVHGFFGYLGLVDEAEQAHRRVASYLNDIWDR
ncbi:MAG: alpha/beta hydrolase [Pseudomonadota bacterium]